MCRENKGDDLPHPAALSSLLIRARCPGTRMWAYAATHVGVYEVHASMQALREPCPVHQSGPQSTHSQLPEAVTSCFAKATHRFFYEHLPRFSLLALLLQDSHACCCTTPTSALGLTDYPVLCIASPHDGRSSTQP